MVKQTKQKPTARRRTYIMVATDPASRAKWSALAKQNGLSLAAFVRYLLSQAAQINQNKETA